MNKLTAEKCRETIKKFKRLKEKFGGIAMESELNLQAYELALPILEQQERGEGEWIEWVGGNCPVGDCGLVVAKLRDGTELKPLPADDLAWWHNEPGFFNGRDIIAYRIIPERATNQNGEQ